MAKTLNHYSQQIKALAPDVLALSQARQLGTLLIEAKAAVKAAGRLWGDWLQDDCLLSARTAQRFMTIAKRWDEPAFVEARQQRPDLPLREADKVLAANSTRKRAEPEQPDPCSVAMSKLATAAWELSRAAEIRQLDQWAGAELQAAQEAIAVARKALMKAAHGEETAAAWDSSFEPPTRRVELQVGDRCSTRAPHGSINGTVVEVHPVPGDWSTYSWRSDESGQIQHIGWGMPGHGMAASIDKGPI